MSSPLTPRVCGAYRAFTLIELLTVIAIIGVLAAITFGVVKGVQERSAIGKAKAELSTVASALEAYKRQYGDYPQTGVDNAGPSATSVDADDAERRLFNALVGKLGPKMASIEGRAFLDIDQIQLLSSDAVDLPAATGTTSVNNAFVDPWGRLYQYAYRDKDLLRASSTAGASNHWRSYTLYSAGPDGLTGLTINPDTGVVSVGDAAQAADNIFATP